MTQALSTASAPAMQKYRIAVAAATQGHFCQPLGPLAQLAKALRGRAGVSSYQVARIL